MALELNITPVFEQGLAGCMKWHVIVAYDNAKVRTNRPSSPRRRV